MRGAIVVRFTLFGLATACADSPVTAPTPNPQSPLSITQLQFRVQPTESYAGAPIAPTIEVAALTSDRTVASWFDGDITLSVDDGTAGSEGTMTVGARAAARAGVAQFGDASIDQPGRGYTLRAKIGQISSQSLPFDVTPAPPVAFSACFMWAGGAIDEFCGEGGIAILGPDGSVNSVSVSPGRCLLDPAWSPDGKYIAVVGTLDCQSLQNPDIYLISLEDGTERRLTHGEYSSVEVPSWSPDGRRLAFSAVPKDKAQAAAIYTMNRDGSNAAPLAGLFGIGVAWSPDGTRIVFAALYAGTRYAIWVADADGSHARKLTESDVSEGFPAWSPDGRQIAFTRITILPNDNSECQIFLASAEGSSPVQLTHDPWCAVSPAWSPDGTKIVYIGNQPLNVHGLMVINADGSGLKVLHRYTGFESRPVWAPASAGQSNRRLPPP